MEKIALLVLELAAIFILIPLLLYYRLIPNVPIPFLIVLALVAWLMLRRDPAFDRSHLTNTSPLGTNLAPLLLRSAVLCAVLGLAVGRLVLVRTKPLAQARVSACATQFWCRWHICQTKRSEE